MDLIASRQAAEISLPLLPSEGGGQFVQWTLAFVPLRFQGQAEYLTPGVNVWQG